ncbi:hypothetical protein C8D77_101205 [Mesorhizobium loti]|uniref:Uncharacterized protein n=1 Tax=Rhizobium loti TaxID=381 RepID=A0A8E2WJ44_RHILI|nr:hypothetical protein [Mesorhizobium loti]PWJ93526.1 hypothetical protein C8D77_101205 [Mesorhizobium loti]
MSSLTTYDTIEQYLTAQWTTTPLIFENMPDDLPDDPAHFVFVEIFGDFFDQASIGAETRSANLWREVGQLYLNVMTRNNIGTRKARELAGQLIDLFRGMEIGTVIFREASLGAGEAGKYKANYYAMTATINWQRDE